MDKIESSEADGAIDGIVDGALKGSVNRGQDPFFRTIKNLMRKTGNLFMRKLNSSLQISA